MIHIAECTNNFVQAEYRETTSESTISCMFQNQSDMSEKLAVSLMEGVIEWSWKILKIA